MSAPTRIAALRAMLAILAHVTENISFALSCSALATQIGAKAVAALEAAIVEAQEALKP